MTMQELVTEVEKQTGLARFEILRRAREAWPEVIDFKDVQVRLMADSIRMKKDLSYRGVHAVSKIAKPSA